VRDVVGPYRILRRLGEGGMGVVHEAVDERLGSRVALKTLLASNADPEGHERIRREARLAASVSHPNVCAIYGVEEVDGEVHVAMELLEGESLSSRIAKGPMPARDAVETAIGILAALEAMHARGVLHRDLKPTNVFLTPHGPKLLDFGLALPLTAVGAVDGRRLTMTGTILGTPHYMAPERWNDETPGPASDLFSVGALLFEMLGGRPAFDGRTPIEIFHAISYEQPPVLTGGPGAEALDRVIQRALAKAPADRYAQAADMASALREALPSSSGTLAVPVRAVTRIVVLPFRPLRPDPDVDFLAAGLPEAITTSLAGLPSLVVRAGSAGAGEGPEGFDPEALAQRSKVDAAVVGTILRSGSRLRVTARLVSLPAGAVLWSESVDATMGELFDLQDDLARRIVASLSLPLSARSSAALQRDVPATPRAYELYLRANQMSITTDMLPMARDAYRACLAEDPSYAPAWARLGRAYRVMAKYGMGDSVENIRLAKEAFERSLAISPELAVAHNLYTFYEVEELGRAREAMTRLVGRARASPTDPDLFAGLVLACRFCGLLDESLAADRRARRLDPGIRTSVGYTHWAAGDPARAMEAEDQDMRWLVLYSLPLLGREADAVAEARRLRLRHGDGPKALAIDGLIGALEGRGALVVEVSHRLPATGFHDPEGLYFIGRALAYVGETERALALLARVVDGGFHVPQILRTDPWLTSIRAVPEFEELVRRAEEGRAASSAAFLAAGGPSLL